MDGTVRRRTCFATLLWALSGMPADAAPAESAQFFIEPSDVQIPADASFGDIRRLIQPFENWTLICDENLKKLQKVCNISQSIVDQKGAMVFNWSLAATDAGEPMMILRTPAHAGAETTVNLTFDGDPKPFGVKPRGCNETVCVSMVPVGPRLRKAIDDNALLKISYTFPPNGTTVFSAPLKGLATALAAVK